MQAIVQGLCVGSALVFCAHLALGLVGGGRSAPGADVLRRGPKFCVTVRGQNNSSSVSKVLRHSLFLGSARRLGSSDICTKLCREFRHSHKIAQP